MQSFGCGVKRLSLISALWAAAVAVGCTSSGSKAGVEATPSGDSGVDGGKRPPPELSFGDIGSPVEISSQLQFAEGPVWDPHRGALFLSDIDGDTVYQLTPPSSLDVFRQPSGNANGLALDPGGALIAAEHGSRSITRMTASGSWETVVDSYMGMHLNSPDDLIARSDGTIYFTDPTFGLAGRPQELSFMGIFRLSPDGTLSLEATAPGSPNGVSLSPDERSLYVSVTLEGTVRAYDVASDGALSNEHTIATGISIADSMCIDSGGNLYVASSTGVVVLSASGQALGTVALPPQASPYPGRAGWATNCAFGERDQRTLFITAYHQLYRIDDMPVPGIPGSP